jgi:hypothetical protein
MVVVEVQVADDHPLVRGVFSCCSALISGATGDRAAAAAACLIDELSKVADLERQRAA